MINPNLMNEINIIYPVDGKTVMNIKDLGYYSYQQYDMFDEKDFKKYVSDVESLCRNSPEYKTLINYLKNTENMTTCAFLDNVTSIDTKMKIEIHHSPFTLYDITMAVIKKRMAQNMSLAIWDVSEEIMWLHYMGYVGLVPLSETVHKAVHNGYVFVPTNIVRGNYKEFVNIYEDYLDPEDVDILKAIEEATEIYNGDQMSLFNPHKIYINNEGINYSLPSMKLVQDVLRAKISMIKSPDKYIVPAYLVDEETSN